jgi:lauroyl/myristoyl acyltransferase
MVVRPPRTAAPAAPRGASRRPQLLGASYSVGARVLRAVPAGLRYAAASPGGAAWFWISRAQRRAALENYAAVLDREQGDPEVARVARLAFQNYGRMLTDFVLLGDLGKEEVLDRVTIQGLELLDQGLARGRGVVLALPHMGSWDHAAAFGAALRYPVVAVAERFPGSLDEAVVRNRNRFGLEVITIGRSAVRHVRQALSDNKAVALVCDLEQGPGVEVRFFGRRAIVPGGPAAFALKAGAPVLLVHSYGTGPGRYHIVVESAPEWPAGETSARAMQSIVTRFESYIRARPDQWYAFRPIFKTEG